VQVGPLSASVVQRERFAIPPLVGAATILAGVGLVVVSMRRRK
jgi:hypothetical protein